MATFDWPETIQPRVFTLGLQRANLVWRSPLNGTAQVVYQPGERWKASLTLPPSRRRDAGASEALLMRLAGGEDWVRLWHCARPQPRGTLRGTPVLGSSAARGDSTLSLGGCVASEQLLSNWSFEVDSASDGLADSWLSYSAGTAASPSYEIYVGSVPHGGQSQTVKSTNLGTASTDRVGIYQTVILPADYEGPVTAAASARGGTVGSYATVYVNAYDDAGVFIQSFVVDEVTLAAGSQRIGGVFDVPAGTRRLRMFVWNSRHPTGGASDMKVDAAYLALGSRSIGVPSDPTLLAGDMIGAGGQLFQVRDDVTAAANGTMLVPVINRVRSAIAAGTAVLWDRPTATFFCPSQYAGASFQPGAADAIALDLEEIW